MGVMEAFWQVVTEFAPLFGLSFSIFALKGFRLSRTDRRGASFWARLFDVLLSSATGAFLIVGFCVIALSVTPRLNAVGIIGLAIFLSVGGVSLVDSIIYKYFGIHILDQNGKGEKNGE